jgi:peptidoglycan/LPS O-acetylase OafA/YrhL
MENLQKLTNRESLTINVIKAVAILSVIAAHVVALNESNLISNIASSLWIAFGEVGVIIFFIIGGFLYKRKNNDNKEFWKKKFFRIILPWFFCSLVTYILSVIEGRELSILSYIKWILGSGTWYYYITIYTIFLLIFKWIYKKDAVLYFFIGLQIILLTLQAFGIGTTYSFGFITDYLNPFHWAGYFSLGVLIRKYRIDLTIRKKRIVVCAAGIIMAITLFVICYNKIFTYFNIISFLFGISSFILIVALSYTIANFKMANYIGKVGTYSYCIYLLHMQIVQSVVSKIPDSIFKVLFSPFIGLSIMLILILLGLFICKKLPFGDKIKMIVGL